MRESEKEQPIIFTRDGIGNVDRDAVELYGMQGIVLMENGARGGADVILEKCSHDELQHIVVVCGGGNNGGDGYAIARHLHNKGQCVTIASVSSPTTPDAIENATIATKMDISSEPYSVELLQNATLVIDSIFGTGISNTVRDPAKQIIASLEGCKAKIISIDIPSGLDCDSGEPHGISVKAALTITFVGIKLGFVQKIATQYVGEIVVVDIGCPTALIKKYALSNS